MLITCNELSYVLEKKILFFGINYLAHDHDNFDEERNEMCEEDTCHLTSRSKWRLHSHLMNTIGRNDKRYTVEHLNKTLESQRKNLQHLVIALGTTQNTMEQVVRPYQKLQYTMEQMKRLKRMWNILKNYDITKLCSKNIIFLG